METTGPSPANDRRRTKGGGGGGGGGRGGEGGGKGIIATVYTREVLYCAVLFPGRDINQESERTGQQDSWRCDAAGWG